MKSGRPKSSKAGEGNDLAPMTAQRRGQIVELVHERGSMRVVDLAARFGVSEVTIRSDLDQLEGEGRLMRDRGGALPSGQTRTVTTLPGMELRAGLNVDSKRRIAAAAASRVASGSSLLLDAGTTVVEMVRHLSRVNGLTIVTNALNVALAATASTDARVMMLGGVVGGDSGSTLGSMAEGMLKDLLVDQLFLGAQAADLENGLTDTNVEIAQIKRAMMKSARRVTLLMDSSKWETSGFIRVAPMTSVQTVITDEGLATEARQALENLGIEVVVV